MERHPPGESFGPLGGKGTFFWREFRYYIYLATNLPNIITTQYLKTMRKISLILGVASFLFIVCACKDDEASDMITTTVSGTITDTEGKPMFEAQVWNSTTPDKKVKTKKDGTYSLLVSHQGSFKLHVSKKGYKESKLSVKVNAKQHKADLQLDYSYIKALSGTVKDPAGNPIADVVISVSTTDKKFKTGSRKV